MKKTNQKVTRYETKRYYVDIIEKKDSYEAWLTGKKYGISELMFGSAKVQHHIDGEEYRVTEPYFLELVEANLEDYIIGYKCEYERG